MYDYIFLILEIQWVVEHILPKKDNEKLRSTVVAVYGWDFSDNETFWPNSDNLFIMGTLKKD